MSGLRFSSTFAATACATAADIWEVTAPSDSAVIIHGFHVFQTSDLGDAAEEVLVLTAARATSGTTSGSGGQTVTTTPMNQNSSTTGLLVEGLNTTQVAAGSGSITVGERFGWNIRIPLLQIYVPELRPVLAPSCRWVLAMPAPADSITVGATVWYERLGGGT